MNLRNLFRNKTLLDLLWQQQKADLFSHVVIILAFQIIMDNIDFIFFIFYLPGAKISKPTLEQETFSWRDAIVR